MILKEGLLGLLNGTLVGLTAGLGMYGFARYQGNESTNVGAHRAPGHDGKLHRERRVGAIVPLTSRRFGADPATASSIF